MYHSDQTREIQYLQAQLHFKREKLSELLRIKDQSNRINDLYGEIREVELKLQVCFEEQRTQSEN